MELLIFKTNLKTRKKVRHIKSILNRHPNIIDWTVDQEDIDNVMRIETIGSIDETDIINLMKPHGVFCEELPD